MFRHIVMFKIKPAYRDKLKELVAGFYAMEGKVEGMLTLEAGVDQLGSDRSYDLALIETFSDRASFEAYQNHPAHLPVRARMQQVRETSVSCDYEL